MKDQLRNNYAAKYFRFLFGDVDGMQLSRSSGGSCESTDKSLTYGEIVHSSFVQILEFVRKVVNLPEGGTFVDLGCGTGKAVIAAALSTLRFSKVWGIELVEPLSLCADRVACRLLRDITAVVKEDALASVEFCSKKHKKSKEPSNHSLPISSESVLMFICAMIDDSPDKSLPCDVVVNSLCQRYGHKSYKRFLKQFGTFKKYVIRNDLLRMDNNVLFVVDPSAARELGEAIIGNDFFPSVEGFDVRCGTEFDMVDCRAALTPLPAEIVIEQGDIFEIEWYRGADIVYCASLLFSEHMLDQLHDCCLNMPVGSIFISLRPIVGSVTASANTSDKFMELISESFYRMSWHMAKVYIYKIGMR